MEMEEKAEEHKKTVKMLRSGWEARLGLNGRVYYYSRHSHTVQILPPPESWSCSYGLAYGWELAVDYEEKPYFINHIRQQVSFDDPRMDGRLCDDEADSGSSSGEYEAPVPRKYIIPRDDKLGFGFIAGSEKPVVIRTVTPGGPSRNMLLPGDQIIKLGDENVKNASRDKVISLMRECTDSISMTVLQPSRVANSSFLKPGKKLMKGVNRPRVRFAEDNTVNGEERAISASQLLIAPATLKVHLEEDQCRCFKFTPDTTAGDIVLTLCEKLDIKDSNLYSLVLKPPKGTCSTCPERSKTQCFDQIIIPTWDHVAKILSNPSLKHHECHFRLAFIAKDIYKLSREDPVSFEYHYHQCVGDVVSGDVYFDDLSVDDVLRLASLQMLELFVARSDDVSKHVEAITKRFSKKKQFPTPSKISLKQIEKIYGLERFLPPSVYDLVVSNHSKEHRKLLQQHLKSNFISIISGINGNSKTSPSSSPPAQHHTPELRGLVLQLRMQYIKMLSPLHLYGGRYFDSTILAVVESDVTLIVGYHYGISQLINSKTKMASIISDFSLIHAVDVASYAPEASRTKVTVDFKDKAPLLVSMHPQSALNFACMLSGYCRVHENNEMMLTIPIAESNSAPEYFGSHKVKASLWNYPPDADPSCSFYCDFSEPVTFALLTNHISDSVRAMYHQSKSVQKQISENSLDSLNEDCVEENTATTLTLKQKNSLVDDEGVALTGGEVSPKSSMSSVLSASPSSGICSVTSQVENHSTGAQRSSSEALGHQHKVEDESKWNELMVALYSDEEISPNALEVVDGENNKSDLNAQKTGSESEVSVSSSDATVQEIRPHLPFTNERVSSETNDTLEQKALYINENFTKNSTLEAADGDNIMPETDESSVTTSVATVEKRIKNDNKPQPPVFNPIPNRRFSSFKPGCSMAYEAEDIPAGSSVERPVSMGNPITSDEFKVKLRTKKVEVSASQLQDDTEDILTSPLPVTDLARGHKSLKNSSGKRGNRKSWFGGHGLSRSMSLDKGLSKANKQSKSRSLLRNFFSPKRSYSVGKESDFVLDDAESMPKSELSSHGRKKFGSMFHSHSQQSNKKPKFSFFRAFSRKKREHSLQRPLDIGSPIIMQSTSGVYSVFEAKNDQLDHVEESDPINSALPRTASVENVRLRSSDKVSPKARPVSFMTFQKLPNDFRMQKSPKRRGTSPEVIRPPKLPLNIVRPPVIPSDSDSDSSSEASANDDKKKDLGPREVPFLSFLKKDLEEHFAVQRPPVGNTDKQSVFKIDDENACANNGVKKIETRQSPFQKRVKRTAPPPPVVMPKPCRSKNTAKTKNDKFDTKLESFYNSVEERQKHNIDTTEKSEKTSLKVPTESKDNSVDFTEPQINSVFVDRASEPQKERKENAVEETLKKGLVSDDSIEISENCVDVDYSVELNSFDDHVDLSRSNSNNSSDILNHNEITQKSSKSDAVFSIVDASHERSNSSQDEFVSDESSLSDDSSESNKGMISTDESLEWDNGSLVGEVLAALKKENTEKNDDIISPNVLGDAYVFSDLKSSELKLRVPVSTVSDDSLPSTSTGSSTSNYDEDENNFLIKDEDISLHIPDEHDTTACTVEQYTESKSTENMLPGGFDERIAENVFKRKESNAEIVGKNGAATADTPLHKNKVVANRNHASSRKAEKNAWDWGTSAEVGFDDKTSEVEIIAKELDEKLRTEFYSLKPLHEKAYYIAVGGNNETEVEASEPTSDDSVPTLVPPPDEFNVHLPLSIAAPEIYRDNKVAVNGSCEPHTSLVNGADLDSFVSDVDKEKSSSDKENCDELSENSVQDKHQLLLRSPSNDSSPHKTNLSSPTSHMYHSLIVPPIFGKERESKTFSRIKPPSQFKSSVSSNRISLPPPKEDFPQSSSPPTVSNPFGWQTAIAYPVIRKVQCPGSRGERPVVPPKPSVT